MGANTDKNLAIQVVNIPLFGIDKIGGEVVGIYLVLSKLVLMLFNINM